MCGSATLTIVVSSTWMSVALITASVMSRRSVPSTYRRPAAPADAEMAAINRRSRRAAPRDRPAPRGGSERSERGGPSTCRREHAALHALEQRLAIGGRPPARERRASAVADDDEIGADALGRLRDLRNRVAFH